LQSLAPLDLQQDTFEISVELVQTGMRLDQFVALAVPEMSRSAVTAAIRSGSITVDGILKKSSYRLKSGELVRGTVEPSAATIEVQPEKIDFPILHEDDHLLVICKPPGVVVHPGAGNRSGTLVSGLVHYCSSITGVGDGARPGIVHRLDKDTSGVMLIAKTDLSHRRLVDAFKSHHIVKEYLALVHGVVAEENGRIVAPIGRHPVQRKKMAVLHDTGRHAASSWQVIATFEKRYSLLKIIIETGRTHQIRVHFAHLGYPVAGDRLYGGVRDNHRFCRQMLHAFRLSFPHPVHDEVFTCVAPLWEDFAWVLKEFGWQGTL
jgi:23S rRNA pseudouridine1911/1915/1917 synthase